jgi:tetratricopeptide (TPR) repeat protein
MGLVKRGHDLRSVALNLSSASGEIFETMFGEAWLRLGEPAKQLLMLMPCFVDSASPDLMRSASGLEINEYLEAREELVAACLLEPHGLLTQRRFHVHRLVRTFAQTQLKHSAGLETEMRQRLTEALLKQIQIDRYDYVKGFNRIEAELSDILACADWCENRGRKDMVVNLLEAIMEFLWIRGYWSERVSRGQQGLAAAVANGDGFEAGRFAHHIGWVYSRWGQQDQARYWALEAEDRMKDVYPPSENPYTNELLGLAAFRKGKASEEEGRFDNAERLLQSALELFERDTRSPNAAYYATTVKDNLGELYRDLGRVDEARRWFEAVLADAERNDWVERLATANGDLGDLAFEADDLDRARLLYVSGLEYALTIRRLNTIALCRYGLGRVLSKLGQDAPAKEHFREALRIYENLGNQGRIKSLQRVLS